ncbi:MAG: hypothetical protein Ct9H300mP21_09070 [Pseudomonadota bacterium]|nr:MAG: hypothetical protein Ct9H300mP21_09070 [Pseudomonadota bacterium]
MEASPVLLAMGLSRAEAKSSLRVSWGWSTTEADIDFFVGGNFSHSAFAGKKKKTEKL